MDKGDSNVEFNHSVGHSPPEGIHCVARKLFLDLKDEIGCAFTQQMYVPEALQVTADLSLLPHHIED